MKSQQDGERGVWPLLVDIVRYYTAYDEASEQKRQNDIADRVARWTMVTACGTVGAAVLAFVAACIFYFQWGTMQAQLNEQRDDFQVDQRAWIGIELIDPVPNTPAIGQTFSASVTMKNTGKTPARMVTNVGQLEPVKAPYVGPNFSYINNVKRPGGTIAPNSGGPFSFTPLHDDTRNTDYIVTQEFINELNAGAIKIYVHGRIDYEDIFGKPHWTTYCGVLTVPLNGQFLRCETHNDTDDYKGANQSIASPG